MKIAFLRKSYTPYGGAERYLSQLIERLCRNGHEVHIYAHRWEGGGPGDGKEKKRPVFHPVPMIPNPPFLEALSFALFSKRMLERANFDIIHSFERTLIQDIYRAGDGCHREWLIRRRRIDSRVKNFFQPISPLHRTLLFLEKRLFLSPRLKRIIANSERGKREIIRHYGVREEKIEVIYNGVDLELFHPRNAETYRRPLRSDLGIPPEAPVLLFLGSGFRRKGLDLLLPAFARAKKEVPGAVLLVAGKDRSSSYRRKARGLGLEADVLFLGPTRKAKELYAACDLFVLPTIYDPFSNACLEAMASGLPVLTTLTNGVAELMEDRSDGFLIRDPFHPEEIAEAIRFFFASSDKASMGEKARRKSEECNLDRVLKRMQAIYEEFKG